MSPDLEKIAVLLAFALVALLANLKAGAAWFKRATYLGLIAALGGAAWFVALVVIR